MRRGLGFHILLSCALAGCAREEPPLVFEPPLDLRATQQSVGLLVTDHEPTTGVEIIEGRGTGAGLGALRAIHGLGSATTPSDALVGFLLLPFVALGGAIVGGVSAHDADEVAGARAQIAAAAGEVRFAELLQAGIARRSKEVSTVQLIETAPDVDVSGLGTVLEIKVTELGFRNRAKDYNPALTFYAGAQLKIRRTEDGACLYGEQWLYRGIERKFFELAANHAALLRNEFAVAAERLSARIVEDLFVASAGIRVPSPEPGTAAVLRGGASNYCEAVSVRPM